ncbi:MAG: hypothetical protein AAF804_07040 [Bacteroidota bacterium]
MMFTTIQLIVFVIIGLVLVAGVMFIIQDAKAQNRHEELYTSRKSRLNHGELTREHETA